MTNQPEYIGHRQRLREKFLQAMGTGLGDYELLELLLCQALPRQDVKPLAKALIERFNGFAPIFFASADELKQSKGIGDAAVTAIKLVHTCCLRLLREQISQSSAIYLKQPKDIVDYYRLKLAHSKREEFHVLFLNQAMELIKDEILQTGTINYVNLFPRELVKMALDIAAVNVIFIHNHPTNDTTPSRNDIETTATLVDLLEKLGINVVDHFIISASNCYSFKMNQHLKY